LPRFESWLGSSSLGPPIVSRRFFAMAIRENVRHLLGQLPAGVILVAVAKGRTAAEVTEAVDAGVSIVGENYIQEAEGIRGIVGERVKWHFIGHLQKNKVKRAVALFDIIQTVDSPELAREIDRFSAPLGKITEVLVEINSARERQKTGIAPEDAEGLLKSLSSLPNIKMMGLMTVGPLTEDPEEIRPYFAATRELFERLRALSLPNVEMRYLSMGMTGSYRVALEEGANMVRIGTGIFGQRPT
jgi:PLP dependent protein